MRTPEIEVNGVAVDGLYCVLDGLSEDIWIVSAELDNQRPVLGASLKRVVTVLFVSNENARMPHGSVTKKKEKKMTN